jgi:hypothetical protein
MALVLVLVVEAGTTAAGTAVELGGGDAADEPMYMRALMAKEKNKNKNKRKPPPPRRRRRPPPPRCARSAAPALIAALRCF